MRNLLVKTVVNNFCTARENESFNRSMNDSTLTETQTNPSRLADSPIKGKKAVTFKAGLVSERSYRNFHEALISKEQVS